MMTLVEASFLQAAYVLTPTLTSTLPQTPKVKARRLTSLYESL